MLIQEIDDFLRKPNRHINWDAVPYELSESFKRKVRSYTVLEDEVDTGFLLLIGYPALNPRKEFSLSLKRRYEFTKLDVRAEQRSVSLANGVIAGPTFYPWPPNRDRWILDKDARRLTVHEPWPLGNVQLATAMDWFLNRHNISTVGMPTTLRIGR